MTDDDILDAFDRRLADVEDNLPPPALALPDKRVRSRIRGGRLAPIGGSAVAVVVIVVVGVAVIGLGRVPTNRSSADGAGPSSPPPPTPSAAYPSATAVPSASVSPRLEVLRTNDSAEIAVLERLGWTGCAVGRDGFVIIPEKAIDDAADAAGVEEGWLDLSRGRFWIGPNLEDAAQALGGSILVIGTNDGSWILADGEAKELMSGVTPKGRTYWLTNQTSQPCPGASVSGPASPPIRSRTAPLEIIRTDDSADLTLMKQLGWTGCFVSAIVERIGPDLAKIDAAAERAGIEEGWVEPERGDRVWIGRSIERAAAALGASILVIGHGADAWIALDGTAQAVRSATTPGGRTYWATSDTTRQEPCPSG